ncbi:unnamed protein product [Effrenium voratum]|nr:unnamed protein product [Effrenium voratum]
MALSNSVIAPLPGAMALDAAKVAFESFGEVFRVKRLEKFNNFVQVVFYDVRSAARAVKAFGEAGCIPGPQVGDRTVKLAGNDQLSTKDFQNISEVLKSKDGSFFLEFYDIRDAMRYRSPKEPTLDLPPGLPKMEEPGPRSPPGLSKAAGKAKAVQADWHVVIRNLPAKLLTQVMMEAVFQQAGLARLRGFNVQGNKVVAFFDTQEDAQACASHFAGCQWDKSGTCVTADIISQGPRPATSAQSSGSGLSAEAPAFQPYMAGAWNFGLPKVPEESETVIREPGKLAFGSDTSTEVGDSEDDDKHSPARVKQHLLPQQIGARSRSGSAGSS